MTEPPFDWQLYEPREPRRPDVLRAVLARLRDFYFYRPLDDVEIHVGVGRPATCATCQTPWPCLHARER